MKLVSDARLGRAHQLAQRGEVLQAELLYAAVLSEQPNCAEAARSIGALAAQREDWRRAIDHYQMAVRVAPGDLGIQIELAQALCGFGQLEAAAALLRKLSQAAPEEPMVWLLLAETLDDLGQSLASCKARYQALSCAQKRGQWKDASTTPAAVLDRVLANMEKLRAGQREHLMQSLEPFRLAHGSAAIRRVEKAARAYLQEIDATPPDPRQRPKFLYFPDLPDIPYHDPMLQPWASTLAAGFADLREEALTLLGEGNNFESFLGLKPGEVLPNYVGGSSPNPAWDAYFFYRRGKRFDQNHARCPKSSRLIDSLALCHVAHQAPEVCFSIIQPGSHIMPHHGVTNSRLVMHLPLVVPPGCALNIIDAGEHHWREGQLMMFDDTFQHEAWNRSELPRIILLMDCWNPHLDAVEQAATKALVEAIDAFEQA